MNTTHRIAFCLACILGLGLPVFAVEKPPVKPPEKEDPAKNIRPVQSSQEKLGTQLVKTSDNMRDLLEAPAARTKVFYRGYDVYDSQNMGFITSGPEAERAGFRYDTSVPGNGNGGHLYGTTLSAADKTALLEYLKTQ